MKLSCETKELRKALQAAVKIVRKEKSARLKAHDEVLEVETIEIPEYVSASVNAVIQTEGECIVDAQLLNDLIGRLDDPCIIIETVQDKNGKDIKLQISYNLEKSETAKAELHIMIDEAMQNLPAIVPERTMKFKKNDFDILIKKVIFASSRSDEKFSCVQLNFIDDILFANATDTHIIAQKAVECSSDEDFDVVVPIGILNQIIAIKGTDESMVDMSVQGNLIKFQVDNITLISQLLSFKYPPVQRVIPKSGDLDVHIILDKTETLKAINRLTVFNKQNEPLVLNIDNGKVVLTTKTVIGGLKENISFKNTTNTDSSRLGLNTTYLLNIINSIEGDEVAVMWKREQTKSLLFEDAKDKNVRYVLSPVRLSA